MFTEMQAALPSVSLNISEWFSCHFSCLVSSEHSSTLPLHLSFSRTRVSLAEVLRFPLLIKRPLKKRHVEVEIFQYCGIHSLRPKLMQL